MGVPYGRQVRDKGADAESLLAPFVSRRADAERVWLAPVTSIPQGFRNKAKMVVGGTVREPTLGILDRARRGVDLRSCGLIDPRITAIFEPVARLITRAGLEPYDIPARRGELKNLLATVSPSGDVMVRFVLRSTSRLAALQSRLPDFLAEAPAVRVVSANILPDHKAVLEGEREIPLTPDQRLDMTLPITQMPPLSLGAKSFFQTNTDIAAAMYAQAAAWCREIEPHSVWDLYCGVGGFALACAAQTGIGPVPSEVTGVEVSQEAVEAARASAVAAGITGVRFVAADATEWARQQDGSPGLVIVNPPRRGLGPELSAWLETSNVANVVYSSCNARSLADDLRAMPSLRIRQARLFDMFPQSGHYETMVSLTRER